MNTDLDLPRPRHNNSSRKRGLRTTERQRRLIDRMAETTLIRAQAREMQRRDPLYLFLCHLEWRKYGDIAALNQLIAALDDPDPTIRELAEQLTSRRRPAHPRDREEHLENAAANAKSY